MNARAEGVWRSAGLNLLLGLLLCFSGWLSRRVPMPGDLPLPLWPPAGIALTMLLWGGRTLLPGLGLGALLLHVWLFGGGLLSAPAWLASAGLLAQAALGAWLIRRYLGFPHALAHARDIGRFVLLGGLLPALVGAGAYLAAGFGAGSARAALSVLLAQAFGVAIATPVLLSLLMPREGVWELRTRGVALPLVLATGLLVTLLDPLLGPWLESAVHVLPGGPVAEAWWLMVAGIALCALGAVLLLQLSARAAEVRGLVAERTAQLEQLNRTLAVEVERRRETEQQLREAVAEAAAANRLKSELLGTISHELRTPLNAVIGMTDLVLDSPLNEEQREFLQTARVAADQLLTLIGRLLDFSEAAVGSLRVEAVAFRLRELLATVCEMQQTVAASKGLRLSWRIAPELPDSLIGDPLRLRQILQQLLDNAIKFTPEGGIDVCAYERSDAAGDVWLTIDVRDSGIGIAADQQQAIFDVLYQVERSNTRRFGGVGMGLPLCRQLARLLGGDLQVSSLPDKGSCFTLRLPLREYMPDLAELAGALLVADSVAERRVLTEVLSLQGLAVVTARDAAEGLSMVERARADGQPYRLLLIDLEDGIEQAFRLVRTLRQWQGEAAPAVIVLTAQGMRGDAARCRELGVAAYLTKPVTAAELREALLGLLQGARLDMLITRHSLRERHSALHLLLGLDAGCDARRLVRVLEEHGCRTTVVCSPAQLRRLCAERDFEAFIIDWDATDLAAADMVEVVRARSGGDAVRIIGVRAAGPLEFAGVDGWLGSLNDPRAVLAALGRHIEASVEFIDVRSGQGPKPEDRN